ncbi:MAG: hypothetical protein J7L52_05255 [Thermotogae bacterium]|nr:hypothetical protein [Thermotogota bacterium]
MGKLIKIHDIDEFSEVKNILEANINKMILSNVRNLEEKEIERFLREIIHDPNETPHGPTEIADILTTHVHVRGEKRLAAFVLKGRSFQKVSSKDVGHQFLKLRQIPHLGLIVFGAVGNIQDDAHRDFVQMAKDASCDYLIIDAFDFARLFIAYEKICPKDGTPYDDTGTCLKGHVRDKGLTLEMEVKEKVRYTIVSQKDLSHEGAKRYSAIVLLDRHYQRDVVRKIIQEVTEKLKHSNYYRNERIKTRWGKSPAHVVWLFIACDLEDIQNANWLCRTCWVDPSLPESMRPFKLNGNERMGDIEIHWNDDYKLCKNLFEEYSGTKEEVLEAINPILSEMLKFADQAIDCFKRYRQGEISENEFIQKMQKMKPKVGELYSQSGNIPSPPPDCGDYDQACQDIFAIIHNMFLYYSEEGLKRWPKQYRDKLMKDSIDQFYENLYRIEFEEKKLH